MKEIRGIPGRDPNDVVVIKKYTYGDQSKLAQRLLGQGLSIKGMKSTDETKIDAYAAKIFPLVYGIVKAPFFQVGMKESDKIKAIEELDPTTGEFLLKAVSEYNSGASPELQKK